MANDHDDSLDVTRRALLRVGGGLGLGLLTTHTMAAGTAAAAPLGAQLAGAMPSVSGASNTADILVETLIKWEVGFVFGIVGDGINPLIEALRKRQDRIRFIAVRH